MDSFIIAADKIVDGIGNTNETDELIERIKTENLNFNELYIDPLETEWHSELEGNHFRSGCAPVEAVIYADKLIKDELYDFIIIKGKDHIKSDYSKENRNKKMSIYNESIPSLYNEIANEFILKENFTETKFKNFAEDLFSNYLKTFKRRHKDYKPDEKWFNYITGLFRGVDCANPVVDFEGQLVISNNKYIYMHKNNCLKILGTGFGEVLDGQKNIHQIKDYKHLENSISEALKNSGIEFFKEFLNKNALMEVYTCYPIVPVAFLLKSKLIKSIDEISTFLKYHEITITGGMNLSKAPWNNPSLNAIIEMFNCLKKEKKRYGLVHGNGGLGYKQGVIIMEAYQGNF
ncbi:MAG: hypothetical protein GY714_13840 [Desulfobacterales bacterium]|nr:hypothetical protein [Desulfobacterales bacterium]